MTIDATLNLRDTPGFVTDGPAEVPCFVNTASSWNGMS